MEPDTDAVPSELKSKCRICLCKNDDYINMFSYDSKCGKVWLAVMECGSVQIEAGDRLPSIICLGCLENLRVAHEFRSLCLLSDQTLRHYLNYVMPQSTTTTNIITSEVDKNDGNINSGYIITNAASEADVIPQYLCTNAQPISSLNVIQTGGGELCSTNCAPSNQPVALIQTNIDPRTQTPLVSTNTGHIFNTFQSNSVPYQAFVTQANNGQLVDIPIVLELAAGSFEADNNNFAVEPEVFKDESAEGGEPAGGGDAKTVKRKKRKVKRKDGLEEGVQRARDYKPNLTGKHVCQICNKRYDTAKKLVRHENVSHGERKFQCDWCSKRFTERSVLKSHVMAIHMGNRPYKCQFCEKSYIAKNHLRIHIRVHTGERPFKCDVCDKTFSQQNVLRGHQASHSGDRPYHCTICSMRFIRISHLARHKEVVHKDGRVRKRDPKPPTVRPHECKYCGKCFTRKEHLTRHTSCHNGQRPFKCTLCSKTFIRKWDVKRHMAVHKEGQVRVIVPPMVAQAALQQINAA